MLNPKQRRQILAAVTYAGTITGQYDYLYGFFATMYYAALRPCEVNRLREVDCKLPKTGWGELILEKSASREQPLHRLGRDVGRADAEATG